MNEETRDTALRALLLNVICMNPFLVRFSADRKDGSDCAVRTVVSESGDRIVATAEISCAYFDKLIDDLGLREAAKISAKNASNPTS